MMATVPPPEESARAILSFLKLKDVHPNEMVMASQVNRQFLTNGGKAGDYGKGIKYAVERGWLEPLTKDRFRVTPTCGRAGERRVTNRSAATAAYLKGAGTPIWSKPTARRRGGDVHGPEGGGWFGGSMDTVAL
jgi:hypothetical protein